MYPLHGDLFSCNCAYALSYGLLLLRGILYEAKKSRTTSVEKTKQKTYREKSPLFKRGRFGTLPIKAYRSVAQFGSVRRLGRCGRRFESCHSELEKNQRTNRSYISLLFKASLVQLVERRSPKPDVVGSSPTGRV